MPLPIWDPPETPLTSPFWSAAREGRCVLPRSSATGRWLWYPDAAGADVPGATLEWVAVPGTGTVYSYATVRRSFLPEQPDLAPYTVLLVDLDDAAGVRLVGNLADGAETAVGARVRFGTQMVDERVHPVFYPMEV